MRGWLRASFSVHARQRLAVPALGVGESTAPVVMRDPWLHKARPHRPRTWAALKRQFRALRVQADLCEILQQWGAGPDDLAPLLRLVRDLVVSNAVHRAQMKRAKRAAGTARDPHYQLTPEKPGTLRPLLDIVDRIITDLEHLIQWQFDPPIELHELDATLTPTGRRVRLSRLDEHIRHAFESARSPLLGVRTNLQAATRRRRGRKATLVAPFRVSTITAPTAPPKPARRRELEKMLRDEIRLLHPDRETRPRAALADVGRVARRISAAIL